MDVKVKLYGPLTQRFPEYDTQTGLDLHFPDGARLVDLLAHLELTENHGYMVTVDSKIKKSMDQLKHGDILQILPAIAGG